MKQSTDLRQRRTQGTSTEELLRWDPTRSEVTEKEWDNLVHNSGFTKVVKGMIEGDFLAPKKVDTFIDKMAVQQQ